MQFNVKKVVVLSSDYIILHIQEIKYLIQQLKETGITFLNKIKNHINFVDFHLDTCNLISKSIQTFLFLY